MIHIVTDTTSCINPDIARRLDIPVIPQVINFGEESFLEGVDIDYNTFMERLKTSKDLPKTAAPPVQEFIKVFEHLVLKNEPILCIHPSSDVSGTLRSAQTAAAEFPGANIRVVDTRLVASPLGILVEMASRWASEGQDIDTIERRIMDYSARCRIYFLVATLDHLIRGGRIGGAQALVGSLLQIKPILTFRDGRVDQYDKARTMRNALTRLKEIVEEQYPKGQEAHLTILHGGAPEEGRRLAEDMQQTLGVPFPGVYEMPPAIVTHVGSGVLGIGFFAL
jgi:DegV family protein with EDD domain